MNFGWICRTEFLRLTSALPLMAWSFLAVPALCAQKDRGDQKEKGCWWAREPGST